MILEMLSSASLSAFSLAAFGSVQSVPGFRPLGIQTPPAPALQPPPASVPPGSPARPPGGALPRGSLLDLSV